MAHCRGECNFVHSPSPRKSSHVSYLRRCLGIRVSFLVAVDFAPPSSLACPLSGCLFVVTALGIPVALMSGNKVSFGDIAAEAFVIPSDTRAVAPPHS